MIVEERPQWPREEYEALVRRTVNPEEIGDLARAALSQLKHAERVDVIWQALIDGPPVMMPYGMTHEELLQITRDCGVFTCNEPHLHHDRTFEIFNAAFEALDNRLARAQLLQCLISLLKEGLLEGLIERSLDRGDKFPG